MKRRITIAALALLLALSMCTGALATATPTEVTPTAPGFLTLQELNDRLGAGGKLVSDTMDVLQVKYPTDKVIQNIGNWHANRLENLRTFISMLINAEDRLAGRIAVDSYDMQYRQDGTRLIVSAKAALDTAASITFSYDYATGRLAATVTYDDDSYFVEMRSKGTDIFWQVYSTGDAVATRYMSTGGEEKLCIKQVKSTFKMPAIKDSELKSWKAFSKGYPELAVFKAGTVVYTFRGKTKTYK